MIHYLKHFVVPIVMTSVAIGLLLGGAWLWLGLSAILILLVGGDAILPDDLSTPEYRRKWILNAMLYSTLPIMFAQFSVLAWSAQRGAADLFSIGALLQSATGYDAIAARNATAWYHYIGAIVGLALVTAGYATNVAHELTHRTWDRKAWLAGRWLLGLSLNPDFAIEHVYGHHERVGTAKDPAQAKRGDNIYLFALRSTWLGHLSAWELERERLKKKRQAVFSIHNRMLSGYAIVAAIAVAFFLAAGWTGVMLYLLLGAAAKFVLEAVNFIEHYGLIRVDGRRVEPRHSWNTNRMASSLLLFSLTRHSAHHEKGDLPFWALNPYPQEPEMPFGYLSTLIVALIPPLWNRVIVSKLIDWDERYASAEELVLAREQNLQSGIRALQLRAEAMAG